MFKIKMKGTGSWLDPQSAKALSAKLMYRLWERCQGHSGLFVTLTYRRDDWENPQDLYRSSGEDQHVALFIRKVGRFLKRDLRGKWFCKLEFQEGGWVHWHIIILDVGRIPHAEVDRMWGFGFVWLKKLNRGNVSYVCKYAVKGACCPAWLYGEKPRSIKIIRVSSGFWSGVGAAAKGRGEKDDFDKYGPPPSSPVDGYVPIGSKIDRFEKDFVATDGEGVYRSGSCDIGCVLVALLEQGKRIVERKRGWLVIEGSLDDLQMALERAWDYSQARLRRLHLKVRSKHDAEGSGPRFPRWLDEWFRQEAEENYNYVIS